MSSDPYEPLLVNLKNRVELSSNDRSFVRSAFNPLEIERDALIHRPGSICQHQYYVVEGLLRNYIIDEKGTEHTVQFAAEDWLSVTFLAT